MSNALIVSDKDSEKNIYRSAKNIKNIKIINHDGANVYDLLRFKNCWLVLISQKAYSKENLEINICSVLKLLIKKKCDSF